jgi:hypothetical protein
MLCNYLGTVSTPVSTSCLCGKLSASRLSGNCYTGIGECQILGQPNPASRLPSTKGNQSRISLANWLSNCHSAMFSNFGESDPGFLLYNTKAGKVCSLGLKESEAKSNPGDIVLLTPEFFLNLTPFIFVGQIFIRRDREGIIPILSGFLYTVCRKIHGTIIDFLDWVLLHRF